MDPVINLGKRKIGQGNPCFIVAELSGNHNQDINRAYALIDAASKAGVDAIKLQTYTPDTMTIDSKKKWFRIERTGLWDNQTLYELYKKTYTPWQWHRSLKEYAERKGLMFFSTPFDETSVDFLETLGVPLYKIASFEIGDIPLLEKVGHTKKPVIISRGLASFGTIHEALVTLHSAGCPWIAVLHCVSSYPAIPSQMHLTHIPQLQKDFGVVSGLSDHSQGINASVAAVLLGASIVERHLILSRSDGGPDASFSLEPHEMQELVQSIRTAERQSKKNQKKTLHAIPQIKKMIGKATYIPDSKEQKNQKFKHSLFVVKKINKGEKFTKDNIRSIRPGFGLAPRYFTSILNKTASRSITAGTPLSWKHVSRYHKINAKKIKVRLLNHNDMQRLWEIRNNRKIRKKSNDTRKIDFKNHQNWIKRNYLQSKRNKCYVIMPENTLIGYCRFDEKKRAITVSIAFDPRYQNQGYGSVLLQKALEKESFTKPIIAEVKKDNISSLLFFEKNSFRIYKVTPHHLYLRYTS